MRNMVLEFLFLSQGLNKGRKYDVFNEVIVTGNLSTFQKVDKWYSRISLGMSYEWAKRFRKFHFIPRGQIRFETRRFHFSVKFVTWTPSTFSGVDNWYTRVWLGMSCRCAVRIWKFHFSPVVIWRLNNDVSCQEGLVTWNPSTFQWVDKWYFRIWMGIYCRCSIKFKNFYFHRWSNLRIEKWRLLAESWNFNFMFILRRSIQMIC